MFPLGRHATRREFLRLAAATAGTLGAAGLATACAPAAPAAKPTEAAKPAAPKPTDAPAAQPATAPTAAAPAQPAAAASGTVRIGISISPQMADPHRQQTSADYMLYASIYDRFVELDPETLQPKPSLATSWRAVDETTYELKLRKGVKFHDGTPFDSAAAKANLDRMIESASTKSFTARYSSVEAPDAETVLIKLKEPYAYTIFNLGFFQMSVISPATFGKGEEWLASNGVGTGPFVLKEWTPRQRFTVERNPEYWGGAPKVSQVAFGVTPDANARLAGLQAGDVDLAVDLPVPSVRALQADPNVGVLKLPVARTYFIIYQLQDPILSNVKVRQAIATAINREALVKLVTEELNRPANSIVPPEALDGKATAPQFQIEYNPDKAKALLQESGVNLAGQSIELMPDLAWVGAADTAQAIQEDLKKIGLTVEIRTFENAQLNARSKEHTFQLSPQGWLAADPDSALRRIFSTRSPWAYPNLQDPTFEEKIDRASATLDDAKRQTLYQDIFRGMLADALYTPLYHKLAIVGASKKVQGLRWSPFDVALLGEVALSG